MMGVPVLVKRKRKSVNDIELEETMCCVCGELASGYYFGAMVCLPCKSFFIRCTKEGEPIFTNECNGDCNIKGECRTKCQCCRYRQCFKSGMRRYERPEVTLSEVDCVLCMVCGDMANGVHFGVNTCEGCKKFFRRCLLNNSQLECNNQRKCFINPKNRNNCRLCRYLKCAYVGMSRSAIKIGRPKKSTFVPCSNKKPKLNCDEWLSDLTSSSNTSNETTQNNTKLEFTSELTNTATKIYHLTDKESLELFDSPTFSQIHSTSSLDRTLRSKSMGNLVYGGSNRNDTWAMPNCYEGNSTQLYRAADFVSMPDLSQIVYNPPHFRINFSLERGIEDDVYNENQLCEAAGVSTNRMFHDNIHSFHDGSAPCSLTVDSAQISTQLQ